MTSNGLLLVAFAVCVAGAALWYLAPKMLSSLRPPPGEVKRACPHCGLEFEGTRRYCQACGGQIWDDVLPEG